MNMKSDVLKIYASQIIKFNPKGIAFAADLIRTGKLVAFPTETVYGLGANAYDEEAVQSIFVSKGRPLTDPLIVHVATKEDGRKLLDLNEKEQKIYNCLSKDFWPGPLTIIAKAAPCIPLLVTAQTGFVGIRCPSHPIALKLLQICQLPIAAPSANRFAHVSPTRAHHVLTDLGNKGVYVIDGETDSQYDLKEEDIDIHSADDVMNKKVKISAADGSCSSASVSTSSSSMNSNNNTDNSMSSLTCHYGIESTVLKINHQTQSLLIYRQGAVTKSDIEQSLKNYDDGSLHDWTVEISSRVAVAMQPLDTVNASSSSSNEKSEPILTPDKTPPSSFSSIHAVAAVISTATETTDISTSSAVVGEEAPGQAITHYSPDVPCFIVNSVTIINSTSTSTTKDNSSCSSGNNTINSVLTLTAQDLQSTVIIDFNNRLQALSTYTLAYKDLSVTGDAAEAARHLFDYLRWSEDVEHATQVYLPSLTSHTNNTTGQNTQLSSVSSSHSDSSSASYSVNNTITTNSAANNNNINERLDGVADRVTRAASGRCINIQLVL